MQEAIFVHAATGGADVDTLKTLEDEKKVKLFVDKGMCHDVLFEKGNAIPACRICLNGYIFWLKPGSNEVPQAIADIVMTSPENSKYATYETEIGRRTCKQIQDTRDLGTIDKREAMALRQNFQAAQQMQAMINPQGF
jgi:hypothetical protein